MKKKWFKLRQRFLEKMINLYAPYLGAGIKLEQMDRHYRQAKVSMGLNFLNKNYMGTQFGGSLYSMVDPWYMLMLIKNLGDGYIVWDKAASIRFKRPGLGKVYAEFNLTENVIEEIKSRLEQESKMDYAFKVEIKDESNQLICEVDKIVYIRKKNPELP
jgi:transcriptional antiterminator